MSPIRELEGHWIACMATVGDGRVTRMAGAVALVSPRFPGAFLNFISLRATEPDHLDRLLASGQALLGAVGRPGAVFLGPEAGDVGRLAEGLSARGWRCAQRQVVLTRALPCSELQTSPEVTVEQIAGDQLGTWGRLLDEAYEASPHVGRTIQAAWSRLLDQPGEGCRARLYLGMLATEPVGVGLTWAQGGIAGLYCGAVRSPSRRCGVERALVLRRLSDAALDGAQTAVVQTLVGSPVEHLCVHRLGFQRAYSRELWILPAKSQKV